MAQRVNLFLVCANSRSALDTVLHKTWVGIFATVQPIGYLGSCIQLYSSDETTQLPPPPPCIWGSYTYEGATGLVSHERRHILVTSWYNPQGADPIPPSSTCSEDR
jgi:hypothetical protein